MKYPTLFWAYLVALVLFLVIGITMFSLGCNVHADGQCRAYHQIRGTVYDAHVKIVPSKNGNTFYTVVKYHYNAGDTCTYFADTHKTMSGAQKSVLAFPVGGQKNFVVRKGYSTCIRISDGHDWWLTGAVFLFLSFLVVRDLIPMVLKHSEQSTVIPQRAVVSTTDYEMGDVASVDTDTDDDSVGVVAVEAVDSVDNMDKV